ncbi:unnamed protein product [Blepharisma stoltei]|uniref:Uncharacterized protein n=1 Tax=Blepharisma stoltei TaxID=1481888 RepID=A0AAU9J418_9CILI|nr:unnamed protein product [Blepharisma stoltei]
MQRPSKGIETKFNYIIEELGFEDRPDYLGFRELFKKSFSSRRLSILFYFWLSNCSWSMIYLEEKKRRMKRTNIKKFNKEQLKKIKLQKKKQKIHNGKINVK